jgi:hypothetical protein
MVIGLRCSAEATSFDPAILAEAAHIKLGLPGRLYTSWYRRGSQMA